MRQPRRLVGWNAIATYVRGVLGREVAKETVRRWRFDDVRGFDSLFGADPVSGWPSIERAKLDRWLRTKAPRRRAAG